MTELDASGTEGPSPECYTVTAAYASGPLLSLETREGLTLKVDPEGLYGFFFGRAQRRPALLGQLCGILTALTAEGTTLFVDSHGLMVDDHGHRVEPGDASDLRAALQATSRRESLKKESETCICGATSLKRTPVLRHPKTGQVYGCPQCMPGDDAADSSEDFSEAVERFERETLVCHVPLCDRTDTDDALRLLRLFTRRPEAATGEDLREVVYDPNEKLQFVWDDTHWQKCQSGDLDVVAQKFKSVVVSLRNEVKNTLYSGDKLPKVAEAAWKKWLSHLNYRLDDGPVKKVVRSTHSTKGYFAQASDFDAVPTNFLLNVKNGTIDLRSGELRPHRKEDRITRMVPVEFSPDAQCPRFMKVINDITAGDLEFQHYLARLFGYVLTGSTKENKFFIFYQPEGGGGKGTLLELLHFLLGGASAYAANLEVKSLTVDGEKDIRDDLARCKGKRFILAQEPNKDDVLAESLIKKLSSGDRVSAALKYQNESEFTWTAKLLIPSNVHIYVKAKDAAFWDRPQVVPFTRKFRGTSDEDQDIMSKLKAEAPGILAWAVRGCLGWQGLGEYAWRDEHGNAKAGLRPCKQVVTATKAYRESQTGIGHWLSANLMESSGEFTPTEDIYEAYQDATHKEGERALNDKEFAARLARQIRDVVPNVEKTKRFMAAERKTKMGWLNVRLVGKEPVETKVAVGGLADYVANWGGGMDGGDGAQG